MTSTLSAFIGIDWSGAKGPRQQGIQIACAAPGQAVPLSVDCPDHKYWGRQAVYTYLIDRATIALRDGAGPVLVGIDFAFAHPFVDEGSYFPGMPHGPASPPDLWDLVDQICDGAPDFYGGGMFAAPPFADYYLSPQNHAAPRYQSRRRRCEIEARAAGRSPSPTFKAIGADNVATGSMAGMRLLHTLRGALGDAVAIWPFDWCAESRPDLTGCGLILTEIFPSLYFHAAGYNPAKGAARDPVFMSAALAAYDSDGVAADFAPKGQDVDEADALIAAAALRYHSADLSCWQAPPEARQEGWIFGVPSTP